MQIFPKSVLHRTQGTNPLRDTELSGMMPVENHDQSVGEVMKNTKNNPVFILGCSRGGTTLLHSILSKQEGLISFPEANILYQVLDDLDYRRYGFLIGRRNVLKAIFLRSYNLIGFTNYYPRKQFLRFLDDVNRADIKGSVPYNLMSIRKIYHLFESIMHQISDGARWVEKSPQNIFCVDLIERYIENASFIHIIRNGEDNVASLISASRKYKVFESRFGGEYGARRAVNYWNNSLRISWKYHKLPNHIVVRYEDLAENPKLTMQSIAKFLNIEVLEKSLVYDTSDITSQNEEWKFQGNQNIVLAKSRFGVEFSERERKMIREILLSADDFFPRKYAT